MFAMSASTSASMIGSQKTSTSGPTNRGNDPKVPHSGPLHPVFRIPMITNSSQSGTALPCPSTKHSTRADAEQLILFRARLEDETMRDLTPMERFLHLDDRFPENLYSRMAYKDRFVAGACPAAPLSQVLIYLCVETSSRLAPQR